MPVAYVDIPAGVKDGATKKIFQELYEEIHQAWPIPDTRVLIREWPDEAVSQDGRIENVPMRPVCTLAVPRGLEHHAHQPGAADSSRAPQSLTAQNIPFRCDPAGQPGHGSAAQNGYVRASVRASPDKSPARRLVIEATYDL
jgi:hypothetical protein